MTKEQIKEYTARVAQANRTELVVIIYELLLDEIQEGNKQYQVGNTDAGEKQIRKAQGYLQELLGSLDFRYEIALQLRQLYRYVNEQLIATLVQRRPIHLDAACEVIRGLMERFLKYEKETWSGNFTANQQPAVTVWNWNIRSRGVCLR